MTTTEATPTKRSRKPEPAAATSGATLAPTKSRRRPMLIALGAALAILGMLAGATIINSLSNTQTVLVTSAPVQRGETIQAEQLSTLEIIGGQDSAAIPASDAGTVIGQVATVDLPAGSLITSGNVGATAGLPEGESIVGIEAAPAQMPTTPLRAGDPVRIVDTPIAQGEPPAAAPAAIPATVHSTRFDEQTGHTIVDVTVPTGEAAMLASHVATQRFAIILDSEAAGE